MSGTISHIRIDRVAMTGPQKKTVEISFDDGVNIIWGASNAGKSFLRKSIDYIFGGDKVDVPAEGIGYDNFIVWLSTPKAGQITLRRSVHGGDIYMASGHADSVNLKSPGYEELKATHVQSANISKFVLQQSGFREARLLKNERAEKSAFSLRVLIRYLIVDETRMIDEKSILLHHNTTVTAEDKTLIKFLLTGVDGSSVEQVRSGDQLKAARDAKVELLSQLADKVRRKINPDRTEIELERLLAIAEQERDDFQRNMIDRQDAIDLLRAQVRKTTTALLDEETEIAELSTMIVRFEELSSIFASDVDRLSGLEEGNFLLQKFSMMNCPVCGAVPEHQHLHHDLASIELQRVAAEAEIAKIRREETELENTLIEAKDERRRREIEVESILGARAAIQIALDNAMGLETSARVTFTESTERVRELEKEMDDRRLLASYETEIEDVSLQRVASRQRATGLNLNLTASEANELSKVIKRVLNAWNYPGGEAVHFSVQEQDIVVDGKNRRNNGAGIRAILHAAFKVALLVYCRETNRPHPGFIVLDSPLLAYRPADETKGLGDLTEDELKVQRANLAAHFYQHLHSLQSFAQIIVIENHKSDQAVVAPYPNTQFTGNPNLGRSGFFS
jgi:hypothetical protein